MLPKLVLQNHTVYHIVLTELLLILGQDFRRMRRRSVKRACLKTSITSIFTRRLYLSNRGNRYVIYVCLFNNCHWLTGFYQKKLEAIIETVNCWIPFALVFNCMYC